MRTSYLVASVLSTMILVFIAAVGTVVVMCWEFQRLEPGTKAAPVAKVVPTKATVWSRSEFREQIVGKAEQEIIKAVGRPSSTQDRGDGDGCWYYVNQTRDPITGRLDSQVQVILQGGVAIKVNY